MQNAVFPGRERVALSQDESLLLRYRLVLHRHEVAPQQIDAWHANFAQEPPIDSQSQDDK